MSSGPPVLPNVYLISRMSDIAYNISNGSNAPTFVRGKTATGFYYNGDTDVPAYHDLIKYINNYAFKSTSMPHIFIFTMSSVFLWAMLIISLMSLRARPLIQMITVLYNTGAVTYVFARCMRMLHRQGSVAYISLREWVYIEFIFSPAVRAVTLICYFWLMVAETELMTMLFRNRWYRRGIRLLGALCTVVSTVLWGVSFGKPYITGATLPYYLQVWTNFEMGFQFVTYAMLIYWSFANLRYAFHITSIGVAFLSLITALICLACVACQNVNNCYLLFIYASIACRTFKCIIVDDWINSARALMRKQRVMGAMGIEVPAKTSKRLYPQNSGDSPEIGTMFVASKWQAFVAKFNGEEYVRHVEVDTQDRLSIEIRSTHEQQLVSAPSTEEQIYVYGEPAPSAPVTPSQGEPGPSAPGPSAPGPSTEHEELPDFAAHSGFNIGDYRDDKGRNPYT